jgi:hypothetical protein
MQGNGKGRDKNDKGDTDDENSEAADDEPLLVGVFFVGGVEIDSRTGLPWGMEQEEFDKRNGKGNGKGMQGKAIGKPMKGKGKGHASIRCCDSEESSSDSQQASLLPMLRTAAGVLMSASEAEIEQATSAYNDVLAGTNQMYGRDTFQTAYNLRHGMACAAYNAMTVYWQGYKAKGKGKDGKVQKGQIPRTPTAGDGQLILGKDGKVSLNAIDIDEGNAKGKGMKGDKETMAYYKGKKGNDPSLYNEMTMAFEAAKALEQGKRTHRSRSPRSHH